MVLYVNEWLVSSINIINGLKLVYNSPSVICLHLSFKPANGNIPTSTCVIHQLSHMSKSEEVSTSVCKTRILRAEICLTLFDCAIIAGAYTI